MAFVDTHAGYELSPDQAIQRIRSDRRRDSIMAFTLGFLALLAFYTSIVLAYGDVPEPREPANANPRLGNPTSSLSTQQAAVPGRQPWQRDAIEWSGPWQIGRIET